MRNRLRFLMGATALLYLGPLLAGLGGFGWPVVPVFVAIFVLWTMILRPFQWPRETSAWADQRVWMGALIGVLTQCLIVTICFGIGRGIGGVFGFVPLFHPALPVAVSFLSIPLSRLVWDPWKEADFGRFLDDALRQINDPAFRPHHSDQVDQAIAALLALPTDADRDSTRLLLEDVMAHPLAWQRLDALVVALDRREPKRDTLRAAVIEWCTEPEVVASGRPHGTVNSAFELAGSNEDMFRIFLPRAMALIEAFPDRQDSFPTKFDLQEVMGDHFSADVNDALFALSRAVEEATPPELRDASSSGNATFTRMVAA